MKTIKLLSRIEDLLSKIQQDKNLDTIIDYVEDDGEAFKRVENAIEELELIYDKRSRKL